MIRAIIKIPSTPPIDPAIMDIRGLDEWLGLLAPGCVREVVGLSCVEEAGASNCVEEAGESNVGCAVKTVICAVETAPSGPVIVLVILEVEVIDLYTPKIDWVVSVGCGVVLAGLISGAVNPGGQPNALQASTIQQPVYAGLAHDHN